MTPPPSLRILGCRGSVPVAGDRFLRHGGATTAFLVTTPHGHLHIDAGSGLLDAPKADPLTPRVILLTHAHWDHICGLPHFPPLYDGRTPLEIAATPRHNQPPEALLDLLFAPALFPVHPAHLRASPVTTTPLPPTGSLERFGLLVDWCEVPHPGGASAVRVRTPSTSTVLVPDCELHALQDSALLELAQGADHLLLDAHFDDHELPAHRGWGHSSASEAAHFARKAGVRQLWLFHHAPWRTDTLLDDHVHRARRIFPNTSAAFAGLTLPLHAP
ncbi:MAG: MBL fold metallo-hydrolase [Deltaproteobacteria bacterium]|nr:MAG: MBL fold metallo-hydrolase [Deltaproteobacteria bacterium]